MLRRARDDRFWDGLCALESNVIPDAQHALGGRLSERESPSASKEAAALIRDLNGLLPCWATA